LSQGLEFFDGIGIPHTITLVSQRSSYN
jgi:hypothetical protein